ncbi:MAG: hypothetical protein JSV93_03530 [Candidatus Omnitrophota bacterium]|nr:MAG: hypothetical protein JSV93_03530 [Candidatus Omnitrophota bacterium]
MKRKLMIITLLISVLTLNVMPLEGYAFDHGKTKWQKGCHWDFEKKFSNKAHLILAKKKELGLSDAQVTKIKELKIKTKKDLIKKSAEIKMLALDIKAAMWEDPINTSALNKLIDKKYDLKKEKAKSLTGACAALNDILTKEQKEKLAGFRKKCKKQKTW